MFSSDPPEPKGPNIQEFQWPGLENSLETPTLAPFEFRSWDLALLDENSPASQALRAKAEEILGEARQKAQELERQAYEEGFRQGQKDGQEVGQRGLAEVTRRLQNLAEALVKERENLFRQREKVLVDLAVAVGEKLAFRELTLHPEAIRQIIEAGFRHLTTYEGLKVVVSPSDFEILRNEDLGSWPPGVELEADGTLTPGGCRLVNTLGEVDGTWETRRTLIAQAVRGALEALEVSSENS
jgi:flagellar assembly protein FliH